MATRIDPRTVDLTTLDVPELMALFGALDAPTVAEMDGEFDAILLKQPGLFRTVTGALDVRNPLSLWRAKAFRPVDEASGRGYNAFRSLGGRPDARRFPMLTSIAPSRYDGRPVYQLDYRPFASRNGRLNMVDEIRRVRPGVYLGIGTWGVTEKQRMVPLPFRLVGPSRPYAGDLGTPRD